MAVVSVLKSVLQEHNRYKTGSIFMKELFVLCVGKCVEICCTEALEIVGSYYSVENYRNFCSETEDSMKFQKVVLLFPVENQ